MAKKLPPTGEECCGYGQWAFFCPLPGHGDQLVQFFCMLPTDEELDFRLVFYEPNLNKLAEVKQDLVEIKSARGGTGDVANRQKRRDELKDRQADLISQLKSELSDSEIQQGIQRAEEALRLQMLEKKEKELEEFRKEHGIEINAPIADRVPLKTGDEEKKDTEVKTEKNALPFPCPKGSNWEWEEIGFILKTDELVVVKTPAGEARVTFGQLGFADGRKGDKPNETTWAMF